MAAAIEELRARAKAAIHSGCEILVLSDRDLNRERVSIPSLLAIGAVHHDLIREGLRTRAGIVLDTGHPCLVHHFCTLIGYGADAIHPWLAYYSVAQLAAEGSGLRLPFITAKLIRFTFSPFDLFMHQHVVAFDQADLVEHFVIAQPVGQDALRRQPRADRQIATLDPSQHQGLDLLGLGPVRRVEITLPPHKSSVTQLA